MNFIHHNYLGELELNKKEKIKCEAQELNFLKRSSRAKLPI